MSLKMNRTWTWRHWKLTDSNEDVGIVFEFVDCELPGSGVCRGEVDGSGVGGGEGTVPGVDWEGIAASGVDGGEEFGLKGS